MSKTTITQEVSTPPLEGLRAEADTPTWELVLVIIFAGACGWYLWRKLFNKKSGCASCGKSSCQVKTDS
ncbi:MAG: FeoB-associated Cys-rich membrane protein [Methylocystaceae bacterium]|nr:FeoB-associated Cys-rich membrane protein [Methylocystaceae bacterium]